MPIKVRRGLFRVGEYSLAVILPKPWVDYFNLKPGDTVEIIAEDDVTIRICTKSSDDSNGEARTEV